MNISTTNSISPTLNNLLSPSVNGTKQSPEQRPSAVVSLSAQGRDLNQADTATQTGQQFEMSAKETKEPAGIQFMAREIKGGKVDTYA